MEPLGPADPARIAGYRLVARLGAGGMGQVYLARSPGGRPVALKVIRPDLAADPDFRERFVREVSAARSVSGVFTAPVLDADPTGTPAWLATGYVAGVSLGEAVARFGPLPAGAVAAVAAGLAEALAAVHSGGLVHRDVKPANIMLSADGPKLIDFGIARLTATAAEHTQTGVVIGSPSFLSPEQVSGAEVGPPADVFAMASVLVHALTGRPPFTADDQMAVLYRVAHGEPQLDGVREPLLGLVRRCLDKDPRRRPTPQQLIRDLDASAVDAAPRTDHGVLPAALTAEIMRRSAELLNPPPPARQAPGARRPPPAVARYGLGVDLGTAQTAAAVWRDGLVAPVGLGGRSHTVPSVLFLRDDGTVLVGDAASRRGIVETDRVVREFKRRFGDAVPLLVGDQEVGADELTGHLLRWVVDAVTEREGVPPAHVSLTHPATWGPHRRELLATTAEKAGLGRVGLLPEPVAAAAYYASTQRLETGDLLAVYDLGGGTFDATVVRKTADGFAIQGDPTGDDALGGIDFDQTLMDYVAATVGAGWPALDEQDPATLAALEQVRDHVTAAKEALSTDVDATVPVILPGMSRQVRLTRAEFESAIRDRLLHTVRMLGDTIASAGAATGDVTAVLLTGGSSRIPLVSRLIAAELGIPVAIDTHPKLATCLGAAIAAGARLGPPAHRPVPPPRPEADRSPSGPVAVDLAATGILSRIDTTGTRRPPAPDGPAPAPAAPSPAASSPAASSPAASSPAASSSTVSAPSRPARPAPSPTPAGPTPGRARPSGPASTRQPSPPPRSTPARPPGPERPAAPVPPAPTPPARRGTRRRRAWIVAALVAVLGLAAAGTVLLLPVLRPGPAGTVLGAPIPVGSDPVGLTDGAGFVWTANSGGTISKIDPTTGQSTEFAVGGQPRDLRVIGGTAWVWAYADALTPVDVTTGQAGPLLGIGPTIGGLTLGGGHLWVSHPDEGTVSRIDVLTRQLVGEPIAVGAEPRGLAATDERVYVVNAGDRTLSSIDARTGEVLGKPLELNRPASGIIVHDGVIYIGAEGAITAVDAQSFAIGETRLFPGIGQFQPGGGSMWVTYPLHNEVHRFTLATLEPHGTPIAGIGRGASQTLYLDDVLWIANSDDDTVVRIRVTD